MMAALFLFFILIFQSAYGEGPLLENNQKILKFTLQNYPTSHVFDSDGAIRNNHNPFLQNKYLLQADYGLSDKDTLSQHLGFVRVKEQLDGTTEGFTDYELILKHAFIKQYRQILVLETAVNLPLCGDYKPAVRYGNFGFSAMLFYALKRAIYSTPLLISFGAGGMYYNHIPEDFLKLYFRLAICPTSYLAFRTTFRLDYGLRNGKKIIDQSLVDLNPNARFLRGDLEAIIRPLECLELSLGVFRNFWGQNNGSGGGFIGHASYCF